MKYRGIIVDNLSKRGWSWGYATYLDPPRGSLFRRVP
jgi:hypothetical protein